MLPANQRILSVIFLLGIVALFPLHAHAAGPDQVLVIYNLDWLGDEPGSHPGNDSLELARYYVQAHTDPITGKKPYMLGLRCKHFSTALSGQNRKSHLNDEFVAEDSSDNYFGIVYKGKGIKPPKPRSSNVNNFQLSSRIEFQLASSKVDLPSVRLGVWQKLDRSDTKVIYKGQKPDDAPDHIKITDSTGKVPTRTVLADVLSMGYRGDVWVRLTANPAGTGKAIDQVMRCFDPADLALSDTGPDGKRDDQHYLDDIETPIKAFLNDPANAGGGRLLKEHILYVVICRGLPRTVRRTKGLAQSAVRHSPGDSGNMVSLCQRLEMMFYKAEVMRKPAITPQRFTTRNGSFARQVAVTNYWDSFIGRRYQPFAHPAAYLRKYPESGYVSPPWKPAPRFSTEFRKKFPNRHLFMCSRIDATNLEDAKHLIDSAKYAQVYLTSAIGTANAAVPDMAGALGKVGKAVGIDELKILKLPGCDRSKNYSAYFGRRPGGGYYPGAIDWFVISANGLNRPDSQVLQMLSDRVTVTGGAARAYAGCPHTTTHGWWDNRCFYYFLFRGYQLGESWMLSRLYCQWATSFYGDPLYCPNLFKTRVDTISPVVAKKEDVSIELFDSFSDRCAIVRMKLKTDAEKPELVRTRIEYWPRGKEQAKQVSNDPWYRSRAKVVLRHLRPATMYEYRFVLTDPYGNVFDSAKADGFSALTFLSGINPGMPRGIKRPQKTTKFYIGGPTRKDRPNVESGQIDIIYAGPAKAGGTIVSCGDLRLLRTGGDRLSISVGGGFCKGVFKFVPGQLYNISIRYRREPLTREVLLIAANGKEFVILADNRTAWKNPQLAENIFFPQSKSAGYVRNIALYARSEVCSDAGNQARVNFDLKAYEQLLRK